MGAVVNYDFYSSVYLGTEVDSTSFPALCARAEDIIGGLTHWAVNDTNIGNLPSLAQMHYKKAICAQVDMFGVNGLEILSTEAGRGFTVGKVSVNGKNNITTGKRADYIAPMALLYLEQSGLMNPQVQTVGW